MTDKEQELLIIKTLAGIMRQVFVDGDGEICVNGEAFDVLRAAVAAEHERLLRVMACNLTPQYLKDRVAVATLCDELLDRSGALLGYVREAAAAKEIAVAIRKGE